MLFFLGGRVILLYEHHLNLFGTFKKPAGQRVNTVNSFRTKLHTGAKLSSMFSVTGVLCSVKVEVV